MLCPWYPCSNYIILHVPQTDVVFIHINRSRNDFRTAALENLCKKRQKMWNAMLRTEGRFVSAVPKYDNVKTRLCQGRQNFHGTEQNPENTLKIVFLEGVLRLANNWDFLQIDHTDESSLLEKALNIYLEAELLFILDVVFKSCPIHFFQLYSSHVDRESTSHKNYIHSVVSALLVDKKKQHIIVCWLCEELVFSVVTNNYKRELWDSGHQCNK
jgi:hypothetical protein